MGKRKPPCTNPFGQEAHKGLGTHTVSAKLLAECQKYEILINYTASDKICVRCFGRIKDHIHSATEKKRKELAERKRSKRRAESNEEEEIEVTAGPSYSHQSVESKAKMSRLEDITTRDCVMTASSCSTETTDPPSQTSSSQPSQSMILEDVNITLEQLGVSAMRKTDLRRTKIMAKKYLQTHEALANKFRSITKKPVHLQQDCENCTKLISDLVARFAEAKTRREKLQILTCVPVGMSYRRVQTLFGCTKYIALQALQLKKEHGAFFAPDFVQPKRSLELEVKVAVKNFYVDDGNSRVFPGERNTVVAEDIDGVKRRVSKRHILLNLEELHAEFKNEYPSMKIGLTSFSKLKPTFCKWPGPTGHHITCTCVIHENFKALIMAAGLKCKTEEFLRKYLCANARPDCHQGFCSECPKLDKIEEDITRIMEENENEEVVFNLWQSTDRMTLIQVRESADAFTTRICEQFPKVCCHHFIFKKQSSYIQGLKDKLETEETSLVCTVDFGMNYSFIGQNEPQSAHFSRRQCTVHPFVVDGIINKEKVQKSYIIISDDLNHNTNSFHAFQEEALDLIKVDFPNYKKIYYISDGSAAQYKNFKNLANLVHHKVDFKTDAEWHFTATAHGKSTCDAMTAVIKREARLASLKPDEIIQNVDQLEFFCNKKWKNSTSIKVKLVKVAKVQEHLAKLEQRYEDASRLKGIQKIHSFVPIEGSEKVCVRRYSSSESYDIFHMFSKSSSQDNSCLQIGTLVAVKVLSTFHIGKILRNADDDGATFVVSFMKRVGKKNLFIWPQAPKEEEINPAEILGSIESMNAVSDMQFSLSAAELKKFNRLKNVVST